MPSNITVYDQFEQGSDLWYRARMGMVTTSCLKLVMRKGVGVKDSVGRDDYLNELISELKYGEPAALYKYTNQHMDRGHEWEADVLLAYKECHAGVQVDHVAFIRNDEFMVGCSPDGLVGKDGGVEIKTLLPKLMIRHKRNPGLPQEHMAQLQGSMMVTGRQWWDLVLYTPGDYWEERVFRDESFISEIKRFLDPFQREMEKAALDVTDQVHTLKSLRARLDRRFNERLMEEVGMGDLPAPWPTPRPEPRPIKELLQASLEREQQLEDGE